MKKQKVNYKNYADDRQLNLYKKFPSTHYLSNPNNVLHVMAWCTFWRRNLHRFCEDYLQIHLYWFQQITLYMMGISNLITIIASRNDSKSFMIALYACCKCILYPGTKFVIGSAKIPCIFNYFHLEVFTIIEKNWSDEEISYLIHNFDKCTYPEIASYLKRSRSSIQHKLSRLGLSKNNYCNQKKKLNDNYFDCIDTQDKAYWLGFIAADGTINHYKNGSYGFKITLQERDSEHLRKFLKSINAEFDVKMITVNNEYKACEVSFRSKTMVLDLHKYFDYKKTFNLHLPDIDKSLMRHFIRGFIDGDGCFYINQKRKKGTCEIVGYDSGILPEIKDELYSSGISSNIYTKRAFNSKLMVCAKESLIKLHHYLYDGATIFMDRKYEKSSEILKLAS